MQYCLLILGGVCNCLVQSFLLVWLLLQIIFILVFPNNSSVVFAFQNRSPQIQRTTFGQNSLVQKNVEKKDREANCIFSTFSQISSLSQLFIRLSSFITFPTFHQVVEFHHFPNFSSGCQLSSLSKLFIRLSTFITFQTFHQVADFHHFPNFSSASLTSSFSKLCIRLSTFNRL